MRWLFNHGISASELFSGDTMEVCDKSLIWFKNNLHFTNNTVDEYLGHIFTYSLDIIISYIIENKVRFVGPFNNFYIDFEMFVDEEFKKHRQIGRMQDIDIISSDFTGYQLTYYYKYSKNDSRFKKLNFYIGKKHRQLFLDKVNAGEKMYSIKDVNLEFFLPQIYEQFPRLGKQEIKRILYKGYYRMYYAIKQQCFITIKSDKLKSTFFLGTFYKDPKRQILEYSFRMRKKLIKISKWREDVFDDYYFIGISKDMFIDWVNMNNKKDRAGWRWVRFQNVIVRRQLTAALYNSTYSYIFKVKVRKKDMKSWGFKIIDKKFKDVIYVGKAINYKLYPSEKHWKDLIKEYNEERDD